MTDAPLRVQGLSVEIAGKCVCEKLDWSVAPGERWALLGANGAGKTTLLRTLAGLRAPRTGHILLGGAPLQALGAKTRALRRGMMFQTDDDAFESTVLDAVLAGRHPHVPAWGWESARDVAFARDALRRVDLAGFEQRSVARLSGGERRRVALATLLAHDPPLLLLDEPTSHLDLHHQVAVCELLRALVAERAKAVMCSLHDVNLVPRACSHALLLLGGGQTVQGAVSEVLRPDLLERVYSHRLVRVEGPAGPLFAPA